MNVSSHVSKYLSPTSQAAFAANEAGKTNEGAPVEPSSPNVALLRKVQRLVFTPTVKTLQEAENRLASMIDAIDDDEKEAVKKNGTPPE